MRSILLAIAFASSIGMTRPSGLIDPLWTLLSSVWTEASTKEGGGCDPDGRCLPAPQPQPSTKEAAGQTPSASPTAHKASNRRPWSWRARKR